MRKRRLTPALAAVVLAGSMVFAGASVAAAASGMQIFVETPGDGVLTIDVESSDTIDQVKQTIQDTTGISTAQPPAPVLGVAALLLVLGVALLTRSRRRLL